MFDVQKIKNKLFRHHQSAGVTMVLSGEDISYHLLILERQKEEIIINHQVCDIKSIDQLVEQLPNNIPVQLCLHGRGILHKKIPKNSDQQLIQSVLSNANPEQFYLQKNNASNGLVCSIIRRQTLDDKIKNLQDKGLWITSIALGVFNIQLLWPYLGKPNTIQSHQHQIQFTSDGKIDTFSSSSTSEPTSIKVGEDLVDTKLLPSYSLALKAMLNYPDHFNTLAVETSKAEYQQKLIFDKGWRIALGLVAAILLVNTAFFYNYKNKNNNLIGASSYALNQISELDTLKSRIDQHQQLVKLTSVNQSTDLSYFADQIGQTLLKDLKLVELNIFPLIGSPKDYEKDSLIKYDRQKIQIKGQCSNSLTYNKWINQLEELDWVSSVQHLDYKDITNNLAEFELTITIESSL